MVAISKVRKGVLLKGIFFFFNFVDLKVFTWLGVSLNFYLVMDLGFRQRWYLTLHLSETRIFASFTKTKNAIMKGAVLIIGSLYWDIHQNKHLNVRENWRTNHLQMNNRIHVRVPIRYGRTSGKGDNKVYTMVFSGSLQADQWGTAYAVPFKFDINNFAGFYDQAKSLSYAEGANDTKIVKGDDIWCVIGILFNPQFDAGQKQAILDQYQQQLDAEHLGDEFTRFCIAPEPSILSPQGEILIQWPVATNSKHQAALDKLDFIIASCPKQNLEVYPDAAAIKVLVLRDDRDYFYNNVAHGITTYQDREIVQA